MASSKTSNMTACVTLCYSVLLCSLLDILLA